MIFHKRKYLVYARNYAPGKLHREYVNSKGVHYVHVIWDNHKRPSGYIHMTFKKSEVIITRLDTKFYKFLKHITKAIIQFIFAKQIKKYKENAKQNNRTSKEAS